MTYNEKFCEWYNNKYDANITPDTIEYELSAYEADILFEMFDDETGD
jgi:hypothetical protein